MATQTQTLAETPVACDYCLKSIDGGTLHRITVHGIVLDLCGTDVAYIGRRPVHARARIILRLVRLYGGAQAEDGGDDGPDGPAPSPAAPSAARPFSVTTVSGGPVYLTAEELAEWDAFEAAVAETWDPEPCAMCGRVASPGIETDEGALLCFPCAEGPSAPPAARSAVKDVQFATTCRRLAAARLARQMTAAGVA